MSSKSQSVNDPVIPRLAERVVYNPDTGVFLWRPKDGSSREALRWNSRFAHKEAGCVSSSGYMRIGLVMSNRLYTVSASRLAWYITTGSLPLGQIDHINGIPSDNRWSNLRDVTQTLNQRNRATSRLNTSGVTGVYWNKKMQRWVARARADGVQKHLGCFIDKEAAASTARSFRIANGYTGRCYGYEELLSE